ncbi:unnamed protein product [Cylindrotheca closterium]|uniref:Uncharacterized protein n=1 Tax=Cylindrotheca closterium TaxID=2856 RepID=A0AAD2FMS4_9STRA|nr:unnamed protein product [Cylindrotheca closterium]
MYAVLNNGLDCYCDNSTEGDRFSSACITPCSYETVAGCNEPDGGSSCICGDDVANSVYKTSTAYGCP